MKDIKVYRKVIIIDLPIDYISQQTADFLYENGREYQDLKSGEDLYTTFDTDLDELDNEVSPETAKEIRQLNDLLSKHDATFMRFTGLDNTHDGK